MLSPNKPEKLPGSRRFGELKAPEQARLRQGHDQPSAVIKFHSRSQERPVLTNRKREADLSRLSSIRGFC